LELEHLEPIDADCSFGCFGRFWKPSMLNMLILKDLREEGGWRIGKKCFNTIQHM
jgi:hypothetical protein